MTTFAPWECEPIAGVLACRHCGRELPVADAHRDCRKLRHLRPKLPAVKPKPMRPRDIRRRVREGRARLATELVRRMRTVSVFHKPYHRPLMQAELAAVELATAGKLDDQTCSRGIWNAIRDILNPAAWRPEWGTCPVPIPPTNRLARGEVPKVAMINPVYGMGGTERWSLDLVGALHRGGRARCEVIVLDTLKRIDATALDQMRRLAPAHVIAPAAVEQFLCARGFHLAVSWGVSPLPKIVGRFRPNITCVHGSDTEFSAGYPRQARPVCERFVGVSRAALRPLEAAKVPPWQRHVIHNGVDRERIRPTAGAREIRLRLGLEASDFVCGFIGRFASEKRVELLVDALQLLGEGYRGLLMGSGPMEIEYRRRDKTGRCLFVEHSYEVGNALAVANCFLGLTRDEGFWYGGAEAALAIVPLITTRVGFLEELADELQPLPWIEVPKDVTPRMLADAIETCRRRPPDVARLAAAVDRWTIDRMAAGWARVIDQAVGSSTAEQSETAGEVLPAVSGERIHPSTVASPAQPSCSILMSVFDTPAAMLREAWESILAQTVRSWEMVVVDDGSRDRDTIAELDRIAADPRVRLIRLAGNGGLAAAHNVGLAACRCELVAVMDSDDVALPDRLQRQLAYLAAHREADIVGGQIEVFEHGTGTIHQVTSHPARVTGSTIDALVEAGRGVWLLNHPATIYRRSKILAIGGYPTHLRRTQDLGLWLRAIRHGLVVQNQPDLVVRYRLHSAQLTGQREDHRREHDTTLWEEWLKWRQPHERRPTGRAGAIRRPDPSIPAAA